MENAFRAALVDWLRSAESLSGLNAIEEESPLRASPPWLGIAASAANDWGSKDRAGRVIRIALELVTRGDDPTVENVLIQSIEDRTLTLPKSQDDFDIVTARFLRSRAERRSNNLRATLIEFQFRILATPTEVITP